MSPRVLFVCCGVLGAAAVAAGAVGRHLLKGAEAAAQHRFDTAVQYHQLHVVALLALAVASLAGLRGWTPTAALWGVGLLAFCGSLYGLALGGPDALARLAPFGGMAFILGWLALGLCRPG